MVTRLQEFERNFKAGGPPRATLRYCWPRFRTTCSRAILTALAPSDAIAQPSSSLRTHVTADLRTTNAAERLIVALDVPTKAQALDVVRSLDGIVSFYKVGYELFIAEGMSLVRELMDLGNRVFLDLKMDDVGETITAGVREITRNGVHMMTLQGGGATARAAIAGRGEAPSPSILSVTLLSSMDGQDLTELQILGPHGRFSTLSDYVLWRAEQGVSWGVDGFIASGETISAIRSRVGPGPLIVSPGIRPGGSTTDDHKRPTTPASAIRAGADFLVVGRPIRNAADPAGMAREIIEDIARGA